MKKNAKAESRPLSVLLKGGDVSTSNQFSQLRNVALVNFHFIFAGRVGKCFVPFDDYKR